MNIGEKIKKLRTAKLMTQSDLVGGEITRNMLSRIENGAANPSLGTICYIADRLKVSPGYLLADETDEQIFHKHNLVFGIKKAFMNEDYRICRDMCITSDDMCDDEIQMILAECNLAIGIEEFYNGHLRESCEFLDEAVETCGKTLYRTDYVLASASAYFRYIRRVSATLSSNIIDESEVNIYPAMTDEFCRYINLIELCDAGENIDEVTIKNIGKSESPFVLHLLAMKNMQEQNYEEAYKQLYLILFGETVIPQPMLYFVFSDLEICCREIEDFKGAYEYSTDKIELVQKLLS